MSIPMPSFQTIPRRKIAARKRVRQPWVTLPLPWVYHILVPQHAIFDSDDEVQSKGKKRVGVTIIPGLHRVVLIRDV